MKIVILATKGVKANILYHRLSEKYDVCKVIVEDSVPRKQLLQRRIKKMGIVKVAGQVLFKVLIVWRLEKDAKRRIADIKSNYKMDGTEIPAGKVKAVTSVNQRESIVYLKKLNPDLIIVNGTRIISKEVLEAIKVPFLNMHAGITPLYRGVHGGYWALANQDKEHCGVTVHLIDEGIDTGSVVYQSMIAITGEDNFVTYPYLQFAYGLSDMEKAIEDFRKGGIKTKQVDLPSVFRTHPTWWEYRYYKKKYGVR